jgi:hypothetical protein
MFLIDEDVTPAQLLEIPLNLGQLTFILLLASDLADSVELGHVRGSLVVDIDRLPLGLERLNEAATFFFRQQLDFGLGAFVFGLLEFPDRLILFRDVRLDSTQVLGDLAIVGFLEVVFFGNVSVLGSGQDGIDGIGHNVVLAGDQVHDGRSFREGWLDLGPRLRRPESVRVRVLKLVKSGD